MNVHLRSDSHLTNLSDERMFSLRVASNQSVGRELTNLSDECNRFVGRAALSPTLPFGLRWLTSLIYSHFPAPLPLPTPCESYCFVRRL